MRLQNGNSATPGLSNTEPQPVSTTQVSEDGPSSTTQTPRCTSSVEVPTVVAKPQPKPRPTGKGKIKTTIVLEQDTGPVPEQTLEIITINEVGTTGDSQITSNGSTAMSKRPVPGPRPITKGKGKPAAVKKVPTLLPESGVSSPEKTQNAPVRGSKRGNGTQLEEAPVPKKRNTQVPKPASIPASEPMELAIASPSTSLPQPADSTIDADEIMQDEQDSAPIAKRTLRKRKTVTSARTVEDAGKVPVKKSRGQSRK